MKKNKGLIIILAAIILILAGIIFWLLKPEDEKTAGDSGTEVVDWDTDIEEDTAGTGPGILIPGYDKIYMKAGETELQMSIGNPPENTCYFLVTLMLADGKVLYESDLLEPGKGVKEITCRESLDRGEYQAIARFKCYEDDEAQISLNEADSAFVLIVE